MRNLTIALILLCSRASAQKMDIGPLTLVSYSLRVHPTDSACRSYIRFFNGNDSLLLEYESPCTDTSTGFYTESPWGTRYMVIGLKNGIRQGEPVVDRYVIPPSTPRVNLDQYLKPFWRTDTIYNETVLLQPDRGRLLFQPDKILSVRSFDLDTTYSNYVLKGNTLIGSRMPSWPDTTLGDLGWYNLQSRWVVVTYTHKDKWTGPVPPSKGMRLPRLMAKLSAHKPVTIAAYGMSITRGMDGSAYDQVSPYVPNYMDMMVYGLKKRYGYTGIKLYNAGLPGSTVDWGARYADQYINPLHPDLVIVDFGMNDFWRLTPLAFKGYIQDILHKIRLANPSVEFLLIANMRFDPAYITDRDKNKAFYVGNMQGYRDVLESLQGPGVVMLDMNTISEALYTRKKAKDCIANPLHPNDYMSRWYAQGLLETLRR